MIFKSKRAITGIKKWITALRSGEYRQSKFALQNAEGFCCLGVACKVSIPPELLSMILDPGPIYISGSSLLRQRHAPVWLANIDYNFLKQTGVRLSSLNDFGVGFESFNFDEIADLIQLVYIEGILEEA